MNKKILTVKKNEAFDKTLHPFEIMDGMNTVAEVMNVPDAEPLANLFAASPKMLDALKTAEHYFDSLTVLRQRNDAEEILFREVQKAIQEAEEGKIKFIQS